MDFICEVFKCPFCLRKDILKVCRDKCVFKGDLKKQFLCVDCLKFW